MPLLLAKRSREGIEIKKKTKPFPLVVPTEGTKGTERNFGSTTPRLPANDRAPPSRWTGACAGQFLLALHLPMYFCVCAPPFAPFVYSCMLGW